MTVFDRFWAKTAFVALCTAISVWPCTYPNREKMKKKIVLPSTPMPMGSMVGGGGNVGRSIALSSVNWSTILHHAQQKKRLNKVQKETSR